MKIVVTFLEHRTFSEARMTALLNRVLVGSVELASNYSSGPLINTYRVTIEGEPRDALAAAGSLAGKVSTQMSRADDPSSSYEQALLLLDFVVENKAFQPTFKQLPVAVLEFLAPHAEELARKEIRTIGELVVLRESEVAALIPINDLEIAATSSELETKYGLDFEQN